MSDNDANIRSMNVAAARPSLLAILRIKGVKWDFVAREAQRPEGLERLLEGRAVEASPEAAETLMLIQDEAHSFDARREVVAEMIDSAEKDGIWLTTVLD